jgi:hypothetical protein
MPPMVEAGKQAITGVVPPQQGEALIREAWQSVAAFPVLAGVARRLQLGIVTAPLGWLILAPLKFRLLLGWLPGLGFLAVRYTLTNRRLMIAHGLQPHPVREVALADIDDVRIVADASSFFYRAADLEVISQGQVVLRLPGVPEADSFRLAVINAVKAWVPGKTGPIVPAKADGPAG